MVDRKGKKIKDGDIVITIKAYSDNQVTIPRGTELTTLYSFSKTIDVVVGKSSVQLNSKYAQKK